MTDPTRWDALAREFTIETANAARFGQLALIERVLLKFAAAVEAQTEERVRAEQLKDVRTILRPFIDPPQHGTVSFDEWTAAVDRIAIIDRLTKGAP